MGDAAKQPEEVRLIRKEAYVITHVEDMTDGQKEAAEKICKELNNISKEPGGKNPDQLPFLPVIDAERYNHVFLLEGERGSGKSALLITLLDTWSRAFRRDAEKMNERKWYDEWKGYLVD